MDNNYWEKKYADMHIRLTNRIAELEKENMELKGALETVTKGLIIRQELMARDRFIETYGRKYKIDENAQKLIKDYYDKIAMPLFKLQEDN